jgi:hypothetical protein
MKRMFKRQATFPEPESKQMILVPAAASGNA